MDDVTALVTGALDGDEAAWSGLVDRYAGLVWVIARSHRLDRTHAADVAQTVWLKLVEHLDRIDDPRRLPGWLSTTTRRECLRVLRLGRREEPCAEGGWMEDAPVARLPQPEAEVLAGERDAALWRALDELEEPCRTLLRVMAADPPPTYEEIAQVMDMRVGSIGPTRGRCLEKLRKVMELDGISDDVLRSV